MLRTLVIISEIAEFPIAYSCFILNFVELDKFKIFIVFEIISGIIELRNCKSISARIFINHLWN